MLNYIIHHSSFIIACYSDEIFLHLKFRKHFESEDSHIPKSFFHFLIRILLIFANLLVVGSENGKGFPTYY